jgi:hypothetical protein
MITYPYHLSAVPFCPILAMAHRLYTPAEEAYPAEAPEFWEQTDDGIDGVV